MQTSRLALYGAVALALCLSRGGAGEATDLREVVRKVQPGTVLVGTFDGSGQPIATGSGFFVSAEGDVITNVHVLWGAAAATIKTASGKTFKVTGILDADELADLIRVSVEIPPDAARPLALRERLPVSGEYIAVVGAPLGLEPRVSGGIVSAVRVLPDRTSLIQITALIPPGSNGSPVVDMSGRVLGIAKLLPAEGRDLNYAAPASRAAKLGRDHRLTLAQWIDRASGSWDDSAEAAFQRGLDLALVDKFDDAIERFNTAIRLKPTFAMAHFDLGAVYLEISRTSEAIECHKTAIRLNPDDAVNHFTLGVAYHSLRRSAEAVECYKTAIRLNPDDGVAHNNLGNAYRDLGRAADALERYKTAIRHDPKLADVQFNLGDAYRDSGRTAEAIECYETGIRLKPDYARGHFDLGNAYRIFPVSPIP